MALVSAASRVISSPESPQTETLPTRVVGCYALFDEIAVGGMGAVHWGLQTTSAGGGRTVAIKRIHPEFVRDPRFVTSFRDEVRILSRINNPNVVAALDVVDEAGELWLVMQYVCGATLDELLLLDEDERRPVPSPVAARVAIDLLHGLHGAHIATDAQGQPLDIVHRDISPHNVIVGNDGVSRVLDFGIAKATGQVTETRSGELKGKPSYLPVERFHGTPHDRRSDIYGVGIVLWEMLTGRRLYDGATLEEVLLKAAQAIVPAPRDSMPELSTALETIVLRALHADPNQRYQSALEMAEALEEAVDVAAPSVVREWLQQAGCALLAERSQRSAAIASSAAAPRRFDRIRSALLALPAALLGASRAAFTLCSARTRLLELQRPSTTHLVAVGALVFVLGALLLLGEGSPHVSRLEPPLVASNAVAPALSVLALVPSVTPVPTDPGAPPVIAIEQPKVEHSLQTKAPHHYPSKKSRSTWTHRGTL